MRHGESEFNNANIFTGWCDVALTQRGVVESIEAGQVFASHELTFRKCYSSLLTRAIVTAQRSLEAGGISYTPLQYDWRFAERHYGAFQGLSKEQTVARLGRERVHKYRRSFTAKPPLMTPEHPHYEIINNDPRYRNLKGIPLGESLEDCQKRVVAAFQDICQEVSTSTNAQSESDYSLIVAHNNTLRALVMHLDDIPVDEIESFSIPTAIPFYYDIDKATGKVVSTGIQNAAGEDAADKIAVGSKFRGLYISDERKKKSFLERRRATNDPWLWALHDHQVTNSMLVSNDEDDGDTDTDEQGMEGLVADAKENTELFSSVLH
jgi:2,3-bisphosphoglycerate-dependent phosphoglycerate mutase